MFTKLKVGVSKAYMGVGNSFQIDSFTSELFTVVWRREPLEEKENTFNETIHVTSVDTSLYVALWTSDSVDLNITEILVSVEGEYLQVKYVAFQKS